MARFGEVIQDLMEGGSKAVLRSEWGGAVFLRYSELLNVFVLHGRNYHWKREPCLHGWKDGREEHLEELSLSPGDLFATDWDVVILDPITGLPNR